MRRLITVALAMALLLVTATGAWAEAGAAAGTPADSAVQKPKTKWQKLLDRYRYNDKVKEIMFVKYKGGSKAKFYMYKKSPDHKWHRQIKCKAYVGSNGICRPKYKGVDDRKTPTGNYRLLWGFGIKKNPGAAMKYIKVKDYHYLCADPEYYNKLIDIRKKPHYCSGEHLIGFGQAYYYGANFDYNKKGDPEQDYAIFLHCFSGNPSTGGCIAISEKNMKKALKLAEPGTRICIYKK